MKQSTEERLMQLVDLLFHEESEALKVNKTHLEGLTEVSKKRILYVMETLATEQISLLTAIEMKREQHLKDKRIKTPFRINRLTI